MQLTTCPPPEILRALANDPNPTWHSIVAWSMLVSGVERNERTGEWETPFVKGRHIQAICEALLRLYRRDTKRLAISLPPRHSKSTLVDKMWATWVLGRRPRSRILLSSYSQELTREWSGFARDALVAHGQETFGVDTSSRAKATRWNVYQGQSPTGGGMRAVGAGGGIKGRDVDVFVADDLVKDDRAMATQAARDKLWAWMESIFNSRMEPWSVGLYIGTRTHHDDPVGRLKKRQEAGELGEPWEFLNLPAVAEDDDPLGRAPGEALWPERFGKRFYELKRVDVGPYTWQCEYQGQPTPAEGGMFKRSWLRHYDRDGGAVLLGSRRVKLADLKVLIPVDLAASVKTRADYTAMAVLGIDLEGANLVLLDLVRERIEGPDLVPRMRRVAVEWSPVAFYVESIGFQITIVQQALREGLPVREVRPDRDKVTRAMPLTAVMEAGRFWVPRGAPWLGALVGELLEFPVGKHDDQVDAVAYGVPVFLDVIAAKRRREQSGDGWGDRLRIGW